MLTMEEYIGQESKRAKHTGKEKQSNPMLCVCVRYLPHIKHTGEMVQTGQRDQVLKEEGVDPDLGYFCHFLDVLLYFCPLQFPL